MTSCNDTFKVFQHGHSFFCQLILLCISITSFLTQMQMALFHNSFFLNTQCHYPTCPTTKLCMLIEKIELSWWVSCRHHCLSPRQYVHANFLSLPAQTWDDPKALLCVSDGLAVACGQPEEKAGREQPRLALKLHCCSKLAKKTTVQHWFGFVR